MIQYTKMQGLGNDFIIIDNRQYDLSKRALQKMAHQLCQRRLSIGADGLMAVSESIEANFNMCYINADGSEGEMCGNGARCIARYAYANQIAPRDMTIETISGIVSAQVVGDRMISVRLNAPSLIENERNFQFEGKTHQICYIELGTPGLPHCMMRYEGLAQASEVNLLPLALALRHADQFSKGTNVNFYDITADKRVFIKTYERGVEDFTLACGTGSAATALAVQINGLIDDDIIALDMPGGSLKVAISREDDGVQLDLIGDTTFVSEGYIMDEDL